MRIKEYFGYRNEAEVNNLEELLALPWIKAYEGFNENFYRYSMATVSDEEYGDRPLLRFPGKYSLMAEYNSGNDWSKVAYIDQDIPKLPRWAPNE